MLHPSDAFAPLGSEFGVMGGVICAMELASNLITLGGLLMPKQIRSRTALASAISGLVLGAS